jgi:hypothetical protein
MLLILAAEIHEFIFDIQLNLGVENGSCLLSVSSLWIDTQKRSHVAVPVPAPAELPHLHHWTSGTFILHILITGTE